METVAKATQPKGGPGGCDLRAGPIGCARDEEWTEMRSTTSRTVSLAAAAAVVAALAAPVSSAAPAVAAEPAGTVQPYDFNGDGHVDVAVGIPQWDVFDDAAGMLRRNVGAVVVLWGGSDRTEESFITRPARDDRGASAAFLLRGRNSQRRLRPGRLRRPRGRCPAGRPQQHH